MKKYEEILACFRRYQETLGEGSLKTTLTPDMFALAKDCLYNFGEFDRLFHYEDRMVIKLLLDSIYKIQLIVQ
jgi:hypothetical protein